MSLRNSLNEVASTYAVEDIYGEKKAEFLRKVQAMISRRWRLWVCSSSALSAHPVCPQ